MTKEKIKKFPQHLTDCFIPTKTNSYKPYVLGHKALSTYSAILIFIKVAVSILFVFYPNLAYLSDVTPDKLISLTNQSRIALGLNPLTVNSKLTTAAQNKAQDMLENDYFNHTSPDGTTPWKWIKESGYSYIYAGENLAMDFISAEATHNAWMASDTHQANILNPNYKEIGMAALCGEFQEKSTCIVVQMFGATSSQVATPKPTLATPPPTLPEVQPSQEVVPATEVTPPSIDTIPPESPETGNVGQPSEVHKFTIDTQPPVIDIANSYVTFDKEKKQLDVFAYVQENPEKVLALSSTDQIELNNNFGLWTGSLKIKDGFPPSIEIEAYDAAGNAIKIPLPTQGKIQSAFIGPANQPAQSLSLRANQISKKIYLGALAFLACALILNILIKIKIQNPSTIIFSLLLCGMTILLLLI